MVDDGVRAFAMAECVKTQENTTLILYSYFFSSSSLYCVS